MQKLIVVLMITGLAAVSFAQDLDAPTADVAGQDSSYADVWAEFQAIVSEALAEGVIYRHGDGAHAFGFIIQFIFQGELTGLDAMFFGDDASGGWGDSEWSGAAMADYRERQYQDLIDGLTAAEEAQFIEEAQAGAEALLALAVN